MAVLVLSPLSFSQQNIVLPQDIMKWSKNLYIKDESDICNINDIIRLRHVKEGYFNLIDCSVYTESEVYLGQVFDYMFDDNIFTVTKLIVGDSKFFGLFKNEKMRISRDQIITVTSDKIIVKDLKIKEPVKEESVYSFEPVAG
jgi:sporulation protein YlmC with PRC-barrel domain